jgi:hypothetical protein
VASEHAAPQLSCAVLTGLAAISLSVSAALAQPSNDLGAFVGRWQINLAETKLGRMGPNAAPNVVRSPTFTFVFSPEGPKLRMDTYANYPQPAPTFTVFIFPDGKQNRCEVNNPCYAVDGDPRDRLYAYTKIDSHMMLRMMFLKGKVSEYTSYAVSSGGKVFTMIAWSAETPEWQNIQVFDKQP